IDREVKAILDQANKRAREIIEAHRDETEMMAKMLMEFETLDKQDIHEIFTGKWDSDAKRLRLKKEAELHQKKPATPPPPPVKEVGPAAPHKRPPRPELRPDPGSS